MKEVQVYCGWRLDMASGDGSPLTTPPAGPAYTQDNIQRIQQVRRQYIENITGA